MLHATGEYILPDNVPANEFLNLEGDKMSTSRKWSVEMEDYFNAFEGKQDSLRYMLAAIAPETKDSDFSWKDFQTRNNSELVAILGNFVNRVMVLTHKFYEGKVPQKGEESHFEVELLSENIRCRAAIDHNIRNFKFREALSEMMNMARAGNKYLAENEPWKLIKTEPVKTAKVMHHSIQLVAHLAWWMEPFLPFTASKLFDMLGFDKKAYDMEKFYQLEQGHPIGEAIHLFNNIDDEIIQFQIQKLKDTKTNMSNSNIIQASENLTKESMPALKSIISFDQFSNMDIRVGTILSAEKVKKTDKLLQLEVDLGFEKRTIVSGIAMYYTPESLIGKQVCILANLEPRKIKGIESRGMILMAENEDGSLKLISPGDAVAAGSTVA
jgi:methionyl-tRNA synthetase